MLGADANNPISLTSLNHAVTC